MREASNSRFKKALFALVIIALFAANPRSLAEDLLNPSNSDVPKEMAADPISPAEQESPPEPAPSEQPSPTGSETPHPSVLPSGGSPIVQPSESATASASPTPAPPQASKSQTMRIALPGTVAIDPRAHSVLLPRLQVTGVETLLICGYSSASGVSFAASYPEVEIAGMGTPFFRISGPTQSVMATLNGDLGARVFSSSHSISNSVISMKFVALTKTSIDESLCNDGSTSNSHTISFRPLNIGLGIANGAVSLK